MNKLRLFFASCFVRTPRQVAQAQLLQAQYNLLDVRRNADHYLALASGLDDTIARLRDSLANNEF